MKIIFFDSVRETYERLENVTAMSVEYFKENGRIRKYYFITRHDGGTEKLACNRYTIKRLRED